MALPEPHRADGISSGTIFVRDNLEVLRAMDGESIDLIYLDPPFNSNRLHRAPIGSRAAGALFTDKWFWSEHDNTWLRSIQNDHPGLHKLIEAIGLTQGQSAMAYACFMSARLLEMYRVLKRTGSIYLHCDPTMSHGLKLVMDAIFGRHNFVNEIIWHYQSGGATKKTYAKKHDVILFFSKTSSYRFFPDRIRDPRTEKAMQRARNPKGARIAAHNRTKLPMDVWHVPWLNPQ